MKFAFKREHWTAEAASLWGDLLELGRPATFEEALEDLRTNNFDGNIKDYLNADGRPKGPCALGVSVKLDAE